MSANKPFNATQLLLGAPRKIFLKGGGGRKYRVRKIGRESSKYQRELDTVRIAHTRVFPYYFLFRTPRCAKPPPDR